MYNIQTLTFFLLCCCVSFLVVTGNSFRCYLPTIPVVPLCLFFGCGGKQFWFAQISFFSCASQTPICITLNISDTCQPYSVNPNHTCLLSRMVMQHQLANATVQHGAVLPCKLGMLILVVNVTSLPFLWLLSNLSPLALRIVPSPSYVI